MSVRRLPVLVVILAATLPGCDDETSSGVVVGPLAGPRVAESVLALDVLEGAPVGITQTFVQGEEVHLWVHWEALSPPHAAEALWFDPQAREVAATLLDITGQSPQQITVFSLDLTGVSELGRWDVELFLDGEFMRSHTFLVVQDASGVRGVSGVALHGVAEAPYHVTVVDSVELVPSVRR